MVIKSWSRLLRLPNLLLLGLTQFFIYYKLILSHFSPDELSIDLVDYLLLILAFICVCAAGYIINNIYDRGLDSTNDQTELIPKYFSLRTAQALFLLFTFLGLFISAYLSIANKFYQSFAIFPFSVFILWWYSYQLKCLPLIGNIVISVLVGASIAIIPYTFWDNLQNLRILDYYLWADVIYRFIMLVLFGTLSNLAREIIKDMEDNEVDTAAQCLSTAAYFGTEKTKWILLNVWLAMITLVCSTCWYTPWLLPKLYCLFFLLAPSLIILYYIIQAKQTKNYKRLSYFIKIYMVIGILYWCLQK